MASLYEDQVRIAREEAIYTRELKRILRRSMWISIFTGITVSTALIVYAWASANVGFFRL
ncbi:MAG: hypothetical protein FWE76_08125 [Symbiobacteriaceae bacterium]|nr:hypothetical protein [Symbiobacteriaceae bacterium]